MDGVQVNFKPVEPRQAMVLHRMIEIDTASHSNNRIASHVDLWTVASARVDSFDQAVAIGNALSRQHGNKEIFGIRQAQDGVHLLRMSEGNPAGQQTNRHDESWVRQPGEMVPGFGPVRRSWESILVRNDPTVVALVGASAWRDTASSQLNRIP